uniref:Asp23/Gls24 family envelope stress response protein n=1 Tax=Nocardia acidivorans TaxID=404580 RepID=UPI000AC9635A
MTATATDKSKSDSPADNGKPAAKSELQSEQGTTSIADVVVQKVAGLAARNVRGVHDLGGGAARAFGAIRDRIPGASASVGQGVSVEVGETQAAV